MRLFHLPVVLATLASLATAGCLQADTDTGDEVVYANADEPPTRFDTGVLDAEPESPDALTDPADWETPDVGSKSPDADATHEQTDTGDDYDFEDDEIVIGPADRPTRVIAPDDYAGQTRLPVVVLLHSYSMTASTQDTYFGLSDRIDDREFLLVLAEGTTDSAGQPFWNATDYCCDFDGADPDDVGYVRELLDELVDEDFADPDQIHLFGHSNGAFMSYRLACELGARLASLVGLAGSGFADASTCADPDGTVSVLDIHGTHDAVVYYNGVIGAYPSALTTTRRWAERNGCSTSRSVDGYISLDALIWGTETERRSHEDCPTGVDVELWTMYGSAHVPTLGADFADETLDFALGRENPDQ